MLRRSAVLRNALVLHENFISHWKFLRQTTWPAFQPSLPRGLSGRPSFWGGTSIFTMVRSGMRGLHVQPLSHSLIGLCDNRQGFFLPIRALAAIHPLAGLLRRQREISKKDVAPFGLRDLLTFSDYSYCNNLSHTCQSKMPRLQSDPSRIRRSLAFHSSGTGRPACSE